MLFLQDAKVYERIQQRCTYPNYRKITKLMNFEYLDVDANESGVNLHSKRKLGLAFPFNNNTTI